MNPTKRELKTNSAVAWPLAAVCGTLISCTGQAAGAPAAAPAAVPAKPAWLTDFSLAVKETYDNNVFGSGVDERFLPATYPVAVGSPVALEELSSWVTTVSPKLGVNFAPLLGHQSVVQALTLGYAPDFVSYHNQPTESYNAQRLAQTVKMKSGAFSLNLENGFNYISGSKLGPTYPGSFLSAYATAIARERREQIQDRAKVTAQYNLGSWFVRPTASLLYYDLKTKQQNVAGYQNYPDRYDVNGGADAGYRFTPDLAVTLGYRYGHQYQEQFSFSPYSSPNDYQRVLLGFEGKPLPWLKVELQGGPDFRSYDLNTPTHITPVDDRHSTKYYGEAAITADISTKDALTFKYRQFQWLSSVGKLPLFDSLYDLSYKHKFNSQLTGDLGARLVSSDYTSSNLVPSNHRDDWQYTLSVGVSYAFTPNLSATLGYAVDLGRNNQEKITNEQTREFDRHQVSLGMLFKF